MIQPRNREYSGFPIIAVSATIFSQQRNILLVKRANPPARNQWALPGGVIRLGESPEQAVRREVMEECGLDIVPRDVNTISSHVVQDEQGEIRYHYIVVNYCCDPASGEPRSGSDALEVTWADPSGLGDLTLAGGVLDAVRSAMKKEGIP
ncbi:NUDIX hydrolase [bacterium]|nr:NUDIX hydrolase [bacterium]